MVNVFQPSDETVAFYDLSVDWEGLTLRVEEPSQWTMGRRLSKHQRNDGKRKPLHLNQMSIEYLTNREALTVLCSGMFTYLCSILLLLLAGSLQFRNFTFNYRKKAKKKSRKRSNIVQLADGVTAVAQLYALYSHRARSFNQWHLALYPNFTIKLYRLWKIAIYQPAQDM